MLPKFRLPGGFSPRNALREVGDTLNPINGDTDYDVFQGLGKQNTGGFRSESPQVQGASDIGSMYYDTQAGRVGYYDPNSGWSLQGNANDATTRSTSPARAGGAGSAPAPAPNAEDMKYLDSQKSLYDRLLQSLRSTESTGINRLNQSEASARDSATLENERRLRDFNTKRTDTQMAKQKAVGQVDTNARTLSDSLRRMLGMASGSGSSAYQFAAPNAVARQASQQRSNVMSNYGQNERDLDTATNDNAVDFESILQGIANERKQKEESLRSGLAAQEQGIVQSQSEIAQERARLQGGNRLSAMRPFQDRFMALQGTIDALPNQFNPEITARAGRVTTPTLRDYLVDRQAINATNQSGQQQYSPYAAFLKQKDDERTA